MPVNRGYIYRATVEPVHAGATLLDYHVARFPHSDGATWRVAIEEGRVLVGGARSHSDRILRVGDELEFHRPPWNEEVVPLEFRVVHEDEHVLVVDKPAGLQVLPAGRFLEHTLLRQVQGSRADRRESAPVHRLGRGTSGLVLFGKHAAARAYLSRQFEDGSARKTYLALVAGTALPLSCRARQPIGPRAHGPLTIYCAEPSGKPSLTRLRVLRRDPAGQRSLVAAQPITGRPDQIRIHLAACGAPLAGDPLFGPGGVPISDARPGEGGYFLHATALRVRHPADGRWLKLRSLPAWLE
jgi:23S rRNA pseudouridine1911/1915/1917 synthase